MATSTRITVMDQSELDLMIKKGEIHVLYTVTLEIPALSTGKNDKGRVGAPKAAKPKPKPKKVKCTVTTEGGVVCIAK